MRHTAGRLTFDGNYAGPSPEYDVSHMLHGLGGAIAVTTESTWQSSSTVLLPFNYAQRGGAVYSSNSQVSFETITTFFSNRVVDVWSFSQTLLGCGGALSSSHSLLTFSGSTLFSSNTAGSDGGAIFIVDSELNVTGSIIVSNSSVSIHKGGGIYAVESSIRICGFSSFKDNDANSFGGAIYINGGILQFNKSITFDHNTSWKGGAIYASDTSVCFEDMFVTRNYASSKGGGINVQECSLVSSGNILIDSNQAGEDGGGISMQESTLSMNGNAGRLHC